MATKTDTMINQLFRAYRSHAGQAVFTVAISGIDASGKGFIAATIQRELEGKGLRVANINIDPWQNPIAERLKEENPAQNFYEYAIRWDDLFQQLIIPLQQTGTTRLEAKLIRTDADVYFHHRYEYDKIDILLVEGIFLLQARFLPYYHYSIWVECSFETGIKRAITRNAENLPKEELIRAYNKWYYPAQRLHMRIDQPVKKADQIYDND